MKKIFLLCIVVVCLFEVSVQCQTVTSIADIQNGVIASDTVVQITGIVTAQNDYNHVYVQDAGAVRSGIRCYRSSSSSTGISGFNVGDDVTVVGPYMEYSGESEIDLGTTGSITLNSTDNTVYDPLVITGADFIYNSSSDTNPAEDYEGVLVTINGVEITSTPDTYGQVDGTDDGGTSIVRFDDDYMYDQLGDYMEVGKTYNITGLARYGYSEYKINPRTVTDIVDLSAAPEVVSVEFGAPNKIVVVFSLAVDETTAETASNYSVSGFSAYTPSSAELESDGITVVLTMASALGETTTYTVEVSNVETIAGVVVDPAHDSGTCSYTIPSVVINEVMYDSLAGGLLDVEWVELYNTTGAAIDVSGWALIDSASAPNESTPDPSGDGVLSIPGGTSIAAHGYLVLSETSVTGIPGAVVCTVVDGNFALGNSGDNIALYDGTGSGATLIDGSLTDKYPDSSEGNSGNSIEKKEVFQWTSWSGAWEESIVPCPFNSGEFNNASPNALNGQLPPTPTPASGVNVWEIYR